jgi:chemotaxis protein CheD
VLAEKLQESEILYVEPGQLLVCTEPRRLRTVLGSCVSVCLYDPKLRQGGMNHFMLPASASADVTSTRYGDQAMKALVERLERLGSDRRQLTASVFGGARVLFEMTELMHLGRRNVDFALEWLSNEGIQVVAQGVLGQAARRLEFDIASGECTERKLGGGA